MVWTFQVQADVPTVILQLQFVILKVRTTPHITNVREAGTQDGLLFHASSTFYLEYENSQQPQ
jgi:hypothetical protein